MIYVTSKKRNPEQIRKEFPNAFILDVSSTSSQYEGKILSPFYPHGNIIVPGAEPKGSIRATCVEAIWQGLKVFEFEPEDMSLLNNDTGRNLKRSIRKHGRILGHRWIKTGEILDYYQARLKIYLPAYWGMLKYVPAVQGSLKLIHDKSLEGDVVLLDYNVNSTFTDISRPIAHAGLIKMYIERDGVFPWDLYSSKPLTLEESKILRKEELKERLARIKEGESKQPEQEDRLF